MDWRSVQFDWNRARAFLVTAEEGSLSAAARALRISQPTLGRQVAALEEELGVALFERAGRGLALTPSGLELLEHVRAMGKAASDLSLGASGRSQTLEGNVCISAAEVIAGFVLPPMLARLRELEPGIEIELIASNSTSDLKRREADIAVRGAEPTQSDLIARRLGFIPAHLYAAPAYLERIGRPSKPADLVDATILAFDRTDRMMLALAEHGIELAPRNFSVIAENHLVQWELVKAGLGMGFMVAAEGDRETAVTRVLPQLAPFGSDVWLVAHRELRTSRRVRRVYGHLATELIQFIAMMDDAADHPDTARR